MSRLGLRKRALKPGRDGDMAASKLRRKLTPGTLGIGRGNDNLLLACISKTADRCSQMLCLGQGPFRLGQKDSAGAMHRLCLREEGTSELRELLGSCRGLRCFGLRLLACDMIVARKGKKLFLEAPEPAVCLRIALGANEPDVGYTCSCRQKLALAASQLRDAAHDERGHLCPCTLHRRDDLG